MSPDKIFTVCNTLAMISWIVLIFFTFWKNRDQYILALVILGFSIVYAWLIFSNLDTSDFNNFSSLDGVSKLFSNKSALVAGWIHYLAFDLLTGIYIINDAKRKNINHWATVPALFFTFMLGPVGLLIYLIMRSIKTKKLIQPVY